MKFPEKFGRLLARLWPFWLPLVLLFALPHTRPFGRIASDEFVGPIVEMVAGENSQAAMPAAAAHPDDFDLLLWHRWDSRHNNLDYYSYGASDANNYDQLVKLQRRFPAQPLLSAPSLQHEFGLPSSEEPYYDYGPFRTDAALIAKHLRQLRESAQSGAKLEPDNAFWWVALAHAQWRANRYDLALQALERAAKCPRYDDHTLELARRLMRAQQRYGAPPFFEKFRIIEDVRMADQNAHKKPALAWSFHATRLRAKGEAARALRWAGALLIVGDLMQRDPNAIATIKAGALWQSKAYGIAPAKKGVLSSRAFAQFARAQGRADLAQLAPQLAARSQRVQALAGKDSGRYGEMIWLRRGQLDKWVNLLEGLPFVIAGDLFYLALWWLSANLLLWRARAEPSSRRERVGLALATMLPLLAAGALGLWIVIASDGGGFSLAQALSGSVAVFGLFGAPFVLALCCALSVLRRHRASFQLPPRVDTEMSLSRWSRAFLRWFLPACVTVCVLFLLLCWASWLAATARGWGSVDVLALLPPDRQGFTGSLSWDSTGPLLLSYAVFLCALCLLIWFYRWRWTMPLAVRPLTQSALRWWKESLGVALVVLSWFGLLLALRSAPLLREADARLERTLRTGDLAVAANNRQRVVVHHEISRHQPRPKRL